MGRGLLLGLFLGAAFAACDGGPGSEVVLAPANGAEPPSSSADAGTADTSNPLGNGPKTDYVDVPLAGLSADAIARFEQGDHLFGVPLRDPDGLGPLYIRQSCGACHTDGLRGPGFVRKMSVVQADGAPADDQSKLEYGHTERPNYTAGATQPIAPPQNDTSVKISTRVGPAVLGRGYMEAVLDSEITRVMQEQAARADAIHGRINHVIYHSEISADPRFHNLKKGDAAIGRFGLKARVPTLDDFTADALQGDMGITSPLRPDELPNPDHLTDDGKPGIDVAIESVQKRADYMRMIAIPDRPEADPIGVGAFQRAKCDVCHVPALKTRADYPITQLAGIMAPIFTDFLLHDMGDDLSDGMQGADGEAGPRDWRTPPLIGLRFFNTYLHDSRATTIEEAIRMHVGNHSEANESIAIFDSLSAADKKALLDFVGAL